MRRPLLPYILLALGAIALVLGAVLVLRQAVFLRGASRATARITDQTQVATRITGRRTSYTYQPTFSFQTPDGRWFAVTSDSSTYSEHTSGSQHINTTPRVHDHVPVVYNPQDPAHAQIDTFGHLWVGPMVCGAFALAFLLFGGVFFVMSSPGKTP